MRLTWEKFSTARRSLQTMKYAGRRLGGLAPFVLTDEARKAAGVGSSLLPDITGSASALVVWEGEWRKLFDQNFFAPAFVLPLRWVKDAEDSPRLPGGFGDLAGRVRSALKLDGYGLHLAEDLEALDMSPISCSPDSAFVPLASALYLLHQGGRPVSTVFSTGAWSGNGIEPVDGIRRKIEAAVAVPTASGMRPVIFVPHGNLNEAENAAGDSATIRAFENGGTDLLKCLQPLLAELAAEPPKNATLEDKLHYANLPFVVQDSIRRKEFYRDHLVGLLAERLRQKMSGHGSCSYLVTGVGETPEIIRLLIRTYQPESVLLLCTPKTEYIAASLKNELEEIQATVTLHPGKEGVVRDHIAGWLRQQSRRGIVDVTAGNKEMSILLVVASRNSKAVLTYVRHEWLQEARAPKYGTESIEELFWASVEKADHLTHTP